MTTPTLTAQEYEPETNQVGCIYGVPNSAYHQHPAISNTMLWDFHKRPKIFEGKYITKEVPDEETDALRFGSALHSAVLESPEAFNAAYTVLPEGLSYQSKADKLHAVNTWSEALGLTLPDDTTEALANNKKEVIETFFRNNGTKTILKAEDLDLIKLLTVRIRKHKIASDLLSEGVGEVTFRTPELELGFQLQCRFDWLNVKGSAYTEGRPYGLDIKTVRSLDEWPKDFVKYGYYRAYPFYTKVQEISIGGSLIKDWFWVVVEKQYPYTVIVRHPAPECWIRGMEEITTDLEALAECLQSGHFPEPGEETIHEQGLPDWMLELSAPQPGIRVGEEYVPMRNYETEVGWEKETVQCQ